MESANIKFTPCNYLTNALSLREMLVFKDASICFERSIRKIDGGYVMMNPRSGGDAFKFKLKFVIIGIERMAHLLDLAKFYA